MRLLLDEHISPALVQRFAGMGVYALSVPHVGLAGATDEMVWKYALANDLIVVTANARHFLPLAGQEIHPGLIVLRENGLTRDEQCERLEPAVQFVGKAEKDYLLNQMIEITGPGKFEVKAFER